MYIGYEIMKMNAISNATKLKVIFLLRDQIFLVIFYISFYVINLLKNILKKNEKNNIFCKGFFEKKLFSIKFQINFVQTIAPPRQ